MYRKGWEIHTKTHRGAHFTNRIGWSTMAEKVDAMAARVELETAHAALSEQIQIAAGAGDMGKVGLLHAQWKKVGGEIANYETMAQKDARDKMLGVLETALSEYAFEIPDGLKVIGTVRREDDGSMRDLEINIVSIDNDVLITPFWDVFPSDSVESLSSVKGIRFEITANDATVEYSGTRKVSSGTSNGGKAGKGWKGPDGVSLKMGDAFDAVATSEEKNELTIIGETETGGTRSNRTDQLKRKVLKAAGFVLNGD
jgi:hypothetical protein